MRFNLACGTQLKKNYIVPIKYVTHPNGAIEIIGNRTPREEAEWFCRHNKVSRFPSANHRSTVKSAEKEPPTLPQKD